MAQWFGWVVVLVAGWMLDSATAQYLLLPAALKAKLHQASCVQDKKSAEMMLEKVELCKKELTDQIVKAEEKLMGACNVDLSNPYESLKKKCQTLDGLAAYENCAWRVSENNRDPMAKLNADSINALVAYDKCVWLALDSLYDVYNNRVAARAGAVVLAGAIPYFGK